MRRSILMSKVNTYLGALFILAFGIFALTIGFKIEHMVNPITEALGAQAEEIQ